MILYEEEPKLDTGQVRIWFWCTYITIWAALVVGWIKGWT